MFGRVGSIGGLVVLLIALGAGIANIYYKKSKVGEEYRKEMHSLVEKCDGYNANKDYMDWLVDATHDEVFAKDYKVKFSPGGRLRSMRDESSFDEEAYAFDMFEGMIKRAADDKAEAVVKSLQKLLKDLSEEGEPAPPPKK